MNYIIETSAPIPMKELKQYFSNKDAMFLVDYEKSDIKGEKLLTYLSNLDVPVDIKFGTVEGLFDLMQHYLETTMLVNIPTLEKVTINLLKEFKGICDSANPEVIQRFGTQLSEWAVKIDSLTLYNMFTVDVPEFREFVESHPKDDTKSLVGCNFVSLIKHEEFYELFQSIDESNLVYFTKYFNEYMFKGKNLYSFWATENNPMHLMTISIAEGQFDNEEYLDIKRKTIEEIGQ